MTVMVSKVHNLEQSLVEAVCSEANVHSFEDAPLNRLCSRFQRCSKKEPKHVCFSLSQIYQRLFDERVSGISQFLPSDQAEKLRTTEKRVQSMPT